MKSNNQRESVDEPSVVSNAHLSRSPIRDATQASSSRVATERRDTHVTLEQSPVGIGIDAQMPNSMPRAEDDVITRAGSRDFHDQPGSGGNTSRRQFYF